MKLKTIAIVAGVLAAAAIVGAVIKDRGNRVTIEGRIGNPVVDPALIAKAAKFRFDTGAERSTLRSEPLDWVVEQSFDFPAQREFVSQFLYKLMEVKFERLVTKDAAVFSELGVLTAAENGGKAEPNKTGVEFEVMDAQGASLAHVVFGNRRRGEDGGAVAGSGGQYLRDLQEGTVYLLNGAPRVITKPSDWVRNVILEVDEKKDIKRFSIDQPGIGRRVFTRVGEPPEKIDWQTQVDWTLDPMPAGKKLSMRAIGELSKGMGDLFLADVADPKLTTEQLGRAKTVTIEIDLFDGRHFVMSIGDKADKESQHYGTIMASVLPGTTGEDARKQVDEFNRVFKGRMFILEGWGVQRLFPSKDGIFEEKKP